MNILIDALPNKVEIDGVKYSIYSDFRVSLLFSLMIGNNRISNTEKLLKAFELYYGVVPHDPKEGLEKLLWFFRCGKELPKDYSKEKSKRPILCYEHDAELIYAAFLQQYGIDLEKERIHWWKFNALFSGLTEGKIIDVISIRSQKITPDMDPKEKDRIRQLKKIYALPDKRTEVEKEADFHEAMSTMF